MLSKVRPQRALACKRRMVHMRTRIRQAFGWKLRAVGGVLALSLLLSVGTVGTAFAGTLTGVNWSVSNTQTSATSITYAFSFKTATAGTIKSITMTVPSGTAGTPAIVHNYGIGAGTVALS